MAGKKRLIGLSILIAMLFFAGCGFFSSQNAREIVLTPEEKQKSKLLKQIDRKYDNAKAHFQLGKLYQADGLWAQAEHEYNTTLSFDPVHRKAQAATIKVLNEGGDTAKANLLTDIYINQTASSASASLRLGLAFQKEGMDSQALSCYQQSLRLSPNSAKINKQIGYYYLSKGDKILAKEYLRRSFQLDPKQPEVAGELGRLGIAIRIPRKSYENPRKLDKIVDKSVNSK